MRTDQTPVLTQMARWPKSNTSSPSEMLISSEIEKIWQRWLGKSAQARKTFPNVHPTNTAVV